MTSNLLYTQVIATPTKSGEKLSDYVEIRGDVADLAGQGGIFDTIFCTYVLQHAVDPGHAVRQLFESTGKGPVPNFAVE
jgi:2-polyprenyl-3-methyl-5-hydroxy-6-metoxy-1,4-benzoquinol methylase